MNKAKHQLTKKDYLNSILFSNKLNYIHKAADFFTVFYTKKCQL